MTRLCAYQKEAFRYSKKVKHSVFPWFRFHCHLFNLLRNIFTCGEFPAIAIAFLHKILNINIF